MKPSYFLTAPDFFFPRGRVRTLQSFPGFVPSPAISIAWYYSVQAGLFRSASFALESPFCKSHELGSVPGSGSTVPEAGIKSTTVASTHNARKRAEGAVQHPG